MNRNSNKFPRTALAFYIKIYCKRKGSSETKYLSNLVEATKSWVLLNELEKQEIYSKYKEYEKKYQLQYFNQLKNAEPYMKAKESRIKNVNLDTTSIQEPEDYIEDINLQLETMQAGPIINNEKISDSEEEFVSDVGTDQHQDQQNENTLDSLDKNQQNTQTLINEPLPPTLKTGKDLYHMLSNFVCSSEETAKMTWTSLQRSEKNQYSSAVALLKKDYITKYKEYLNSLSSKELFDYYNKTIF